MLFIELVFTYPIQVLVERENNNMSIPQCAVLGLDEVGILAVNYLINTRLKTSLKQKFLPFTAPVHFYTHQEKLQIDDSVDIVILLLSESTVSLNQAQQLSESIRNTYPYIPIVVGVLLNNTSSGLGEVDAYKMSFSQYQVPLILIRPKPELSSEKALAQLVVMIGSQLISPNLIGVDWNNISDFFMQGGVGYLGFGEANYADEVVGCEAASQAALSHLMPCNTGDVILLVQAGDDLFFDHISAVSEYVQANLKSGQSDTQLSSPNTSQSWILMDSIMQELGDKIEVSIIVR